MIESVAPDDQVLTPEAIRETLASGLSGRFRGQKLLVLIPDHTRTAPLPQLFAFLTEILDDTERLDFMVASGTHPSLSDSELHKLVGLTAVDREAILAHVRLLSHDWSDPAVLAEIGDLSQSQMQRLAGRYWHPSLGGGVPVRINRAALECDHILIMGPTFPHEVVGFSGGAKYLFPGISGPEMIHATHWLGALVGALDIMGARDTPVRAMLHAAAELVSTPVTLISLVVVDKGLAGIFVGDLVHAWSASTRLSAGRHILLHDRPYRRALSCAPPMYDELWTAAKAMYKIDPVIEQGGEIIIYAPHLRRISRTHGSQIRAVGYHVLEYFLDQWDRFKDIPLGVLAHSTHLRGAGRFEAGVEYPRIQVTLASQIPAEECHALNLGYQDPTKIDMPEWAGKEDDGMLLIPKAGEMLHRLRDSSSAT